MRFEHLLINKIIVSKFVVSNTAWLPGYFPPQKLFWWLFKWKSSCFKNTGNISSENWQWNVWICILFAQKNSENTQTSFEISKGGFYAKTRDKNSFAYIRPSELFYLRIEGLPQKLSMNVWYGWATQTNNFLNWKTDSGKMPGKNTQTENRRQLNQSPNNRLSIKPEMKRIDSVAEEKNNSAKWLKSISYALWSNVWTIISGKKNLERCSFYSNLRSVIFRLGRTRIEQVGKFKRKIILKNDQNPHPVHL